MTTLIKNGRFFLPDRSTDGVSVYISDGKIADVIENGRELPSADEVVDAQGLYVSPGFVDIHQHGAGGYDYMDDSDDAFFNATEVHLAHGTTSVMPTAMSSDKSGILRTIENYRKAVNDSRIKASLIGLHLEGPYLSPLQSGAQRGDRIRAFDPDEYNDIFAAGDGVLARWSVAPELEGVEAFAKAAEKHGVRLSIAHSNADFDTVLRTFDLGFRHVTHFYSCTSTVWREKGFRTAGIVEAAYFLDGMDIEIIADGCHLPLSLIKLITKLKGSDRVALVTDSLRPTGLEVTETYSGSADNPVPVIIEDGVAKLTSREAFAGSIATADRLIRTMLAAGTELEDAVRMMTANPIRMMGLKVKKGLIKSGYDADLCLFDDGIDVKRVLVGGNTVFEKR